MMRTKTNILSNLIFFQLRPGTIDKDYPHVKGGYAFEIGESAVMVMMQRIRTDVTFEYQTVCRKDSQDIDDDDR